jgi:hypothetical protein
MKITGFKQVYSMFPCIFKRNLPLFIAECENSTREEAETHYENPSVELITVQKIGWFRYLVVWKVQGYLREGE